MTSRKPLLIGISLAALAAGSASAQTNTSIYNQTGVGNEAEVDNTVEGNVGNTSVITQEGVSNDATVLQRELFNLSTIQQLGLLNSVTHQQLGDTNGTESRQNGDFNRSYVAQAGITNLASVDQIGYYTSSTVLQGYAADESAPEGELRRVDRNEVLVSQEGAGLVSRIDQRAASASAAPASDNVADVTQRSSGSSETVQQRSYVAQESRGNYAEVTQLIGSTSAANSSSILQRNALAGAENPLSNNSATVLQEGVGHSSEITQDGFRNVAAVSIRNGAAASLEGNASVVDQEGTDLSASVTFGVRGQGTANDADISQEGSGHSATTYQFGDSDSVSIEQSDGSATGAGIRADAFVSQNGTNSSASLTQTGDNYGEITQAFGSGSRVELAQIDAGDIGAARTRNSVIAVQYGNSNVMDVTQDAVGAEAILWQKVGSADNSLEVAQGDGRTGSTAGSPGFPAGPTGAGAIGLTATITQANSYNSAIVYQDGVELAATIEQNGTGSSDFRNLAMIAQTGSANTARILQSSGVGASSAGDPASGFSAAQTGGAADEFYFAGGARSAEAMILQTSTGNSASIEQYGRGQYARIEQSGAQNIAAIVQEATATNVTAVIRQTGSNNSYSISQSAAGQYIVVTQNGSNNSASNVVTRP